MKCTMGRFCRSSFFIENCPDCLCLTTQKISELKHLHLTGVPSLVFKDPYNLSVECMKQVNSSRVLLHAKRNKLLVDGQLL
jgi:hypothetical protein